MDNPKAELARRARKKYELLIDPLRAACRALGYNLVTHGSIARDIDLVAIPWEGSAATAWEVAGAVYRIALDVNGLAFHKPGEDDAWFLLGAPGLKPHGRLSWSFHLGGGPYIDLAVMPRLDPAFGEVTFFCDELDEYRELYWPEMPISRDSR